MNNAKTTGKIGGDTLRISGAALEQLNASLRQTLPVDEEAQAALQALRKQLVEESVDQMFAELEAELDIDVTVEF